MRPRHSRRGRHMRGLGFRSSLWQRKQAAMFGRSASTALYE
jgi:hypothetical protein